MAFAAKSLFQIIMVFRRAVKKLPKTSAMRVNSFDCSFPLSTHHYHVTFIWSHIRLREAIVSYTFQVLGKDPERSSFHASFTPSQQNPSGHTYSIQKHPKAKAVFFRRVGVNEHYRSCFTAASNRIVTNHVGSLGSWCCDILRYDFASVALATSSHVNHSCALVLILGVLNPRTQPLEARSRKWWFTRKMWASCIGHIHATN